MISVRFTSNTVPAENLPATYQWGTPSIPQIGHQIIFRGQNFVVAEVIWDMDNWLRVTIRLRPGDI